jgi:CheY-like chemotaxis protein
MGKIAFCNFSMGHAAMDREKTPEKTLNSGISEPLMSHDLRAALADVVGGLQLMDLTQLSGANKAQMERILASSEALVSLMDELSVNLQSHSASAREIISFTNLPEFLERTRRRWVGVAGQKNLNFQLVLGDGLPKYVAISRALLERVLSNLLENSFKYTTEGTVSLSVEMGKLDALAFRVQDSGPGFSKQALQTLFEFCGRPAESAMPGTGIGLHSVKKLLKQIGGKIIIENSDGGARVTARFPSTAWRPSQIGREQLEMQSTSGHLLTGLHFLLAEDNRTSQLVALNMLERLGAKVTVVENGQLALNMIETGNFDVILLDIEMPEKTGIELIEDVRARADDKSTLPMIALTAFVLEEHRAKIMAAGADGAISKPVTNAKELGRTINQILNGLTRFTERKEVAAELNVCLPFIDTHVFLGLKSSVGDEAFYAILEKIVLDLSELKTEICAARKEPDLLAMRRASHVLISLAGAVGASRLLSNAQTLNVYANDGNLEQVDAKSKACTEDIARLIEFVNEQREAV